MLKELLKELPKELLDKCNKITYSYSPELSVLKNDKSNFFDFNPQALAAASWESLLDANKPPEKPHNGPMGFQPGVHPYSQSLDNLDPKEFLVDAGIVLDQNTHQNTLVTASSMPNLAIGKLRSITP